MPGHRRSKGAQRFNPVETLDPRAVQAMQAVSIIRKDSLTTKTQATYESKNKQWHRFCDHMGFQHL